jgi:hypothetical protein
MASEETINPQRAEALRLSVSGLDSTFKGDIQKPCGTPAPVD